MVRASGKMSASEPIWGHPRTDRLSRKRHTWCQTSKVFSEACFSPALVLLCRSDGPLGKSPADGTAEIPESNVEGLLRWVLCSILMHMVTKSSAFWRWMGAANG